MKQPLKRTSEASNVDDQGHRRGAHPKRARTVPLSKNVAKNFVLPDDLIARGDLCRTQFRRQTGRGLSWSGVAEVAPLELLARDDSDAVIERYGARARRSPAPD